MNDTDPTPTDVPEADLPQTGVTETSPSPTRLIRLGEDRAKPGPVKPTVKEIFEPTRPVALSQTTTAGRVRGVVWVRPSELMSMAGARIAGRGIDFHAELARRARRPAVQAVAMSRRAISELARRLPPVTAFGRAGHPAAGATRSGIGLR